MVEKSTNRELEKMKKAELIDYIQELEDRLNKSRNAGRKEKFNEEQVHQILEARNQGKSIRAIAEQFECSIGLIHKLIINNRKEEM